MQIGERAERIGMERKEICPRLRDVDRARDVRRVKIAVAADGAALYCSVRHTGGQQFHAVAAIKHTGVGRNLRAVAECVNLHICVCRVTALMRLRRHQAAELHQSSLCQPQRPTAAVVQQPRAKAELLCSGHKNSS